MLTVVVQMLTVLVQMLIAVVQLRTVVVHNFREVDFWWSALYSKIAFPMKTSCFSSTIQAEASRGEPGIVSTMYHFKVTQLTSPAGPNGGKFDPELANRKEPSTAS